VASDTSVNFEDKQEVQLCLLTTEVKVSMDKLQFQTTFLLLGFEESIFIWIQ